MKEKLKSINVKSPIMACKRRIPKKYDHSRNNVIISCHNETKDRFKKFFIKEINNVLSCLKTCFTINVSSFLKKKKIE